MPVPKLSVAVACRVAGIDRDTFNEHVSAERFLCAPPTVPGRARFFDPDDMIALRLFSDLLKDGVKATTAGTIACEVAIMARANPDAKAISYVYDWFGSRGFAIPADQVPDPSEWDEKGFATGDIRKVITFRIGKIRELNAHYTEEERAYIGGGDE